MRTQVNTRNRCQARENGSDQVAIGFSFASDWLGRWREISKAVTKRSKAKPMQPRITFDTQLKIALLSNYQTRDSMLFCVSSVLDQICRQLALIHFILMKRQKNCK